MIGKVLSNRYKLIDELGSGGMAWVYLAEDLREGQRVAVKILYPQLSQDLNFLQRFSQEAKLAMSLSQSAPEMHVARILDYGSDRDIHYLVMEYVEGHDLRRVLDEEGPLPWQEALDISRQVVLALGHAHQHGIVHRDIKPENIMLLADGSVRVLDFGVARARTSPTLTHSGFVGSPYYAAPEQAMGRHVDIRADLYSLGIVTYEMLAGDRPFQSDTPWAVVNQHIATPPPLLEEVCPDLPLPVARLVRKALRKRPEDRFQTPAEMIQAIEAVLSGMELPVDSWTVEPDALVSLLDGLYKRALQAVEVEEWQEAVDLFSQVLRLDPRYRDVTEQLAEAGRQARLSALYNTAQRSLQRGRWAEAVAQLDEIAELAPDYRDVRDLQIQARQQLQLGQLYRQGVSHLEAGEWAAAAECLAQVRDLAPGHTKAAEFLATARDELGKQAKSVKADAERLPAKPTPERPRRRNLLWAMVAVLILFLGLESYYLYRSQQPPAAAAASVSATPAPPSVLPTPNYGPAPSHTIPNPPTLSPTPGNGGGPASTTTPSAITQVVSPTALPTITASEPPPTLTSSPSRIPSRTLSSTPTSPPPPTFTQTSTSTPTFTPTLTFTLPPTAEPPLAGQIAFPRFDPSRGTYDVYVCRVDGSDCRRVATEASQPDLLPNGTQVVVHSWQPDEKGLILQTLSGQRIWRITDCVEAARPSVDFQGKVYVYQSRQEADRQPRLYRTYGPETRPIKREASIVQGLSPSWLPDGRILYGGCVGDECGILVMNDDGTHPRQVVAGGAEANPEASPDGQQVVFMSKRNGNWEVYRANLDGSGLRRLTSHPANDGLPTWSPDGRHIAFVSDRDGRWAVWVMRSDGSDLRLLFAIGGPLDGQVRDAAPHEIHGWVEERISWGPLP